MANIDLFEAVGPRMVGPSSSHTAGPCIIALADRRIFGEMPEKAVFTLYGSFARTYMGHGTDRALVGGILGFEADDMRLADSFELAEGLDYSFVIDKDTPVDHPNTVDIRLIKGDNILELRGVSLGGGKIEIVGLNGVRVRFTGEYPTLIITHGDATGVLHLITETLEEQGINIATLRMFREEKGRLAYSVIESDQPIPDDTVERLRSDERIKKVMLFRT